MFWREWLKHPAYCAADNAIQNTTNILMFWVGAHVGCVFITFADTMPTHLKLTVIADEGCKHSGKAFFTAAVTESKLQTKRQMHVCLCFACGKSQVLFTLRWQAGEIVSAQLHEQETQSCRRIAASRSASSAGEQLYVGMMLSRDDQEGMASLSMPQQALLNR